MPGLNVRKHTVPLGTEQSVTRKTIFESFGLSINDVVPVANTTERSQLINGLNAAGVGPSATRPVIVLRGDAPGLHRVEWTNNGSDWRPVSGVLRFNSEASATAWATANAGLLSWGDWAVIANALFRWSGTGWVAEVFPWARLTAQNGWTANTANNGPDVGRDGMTAYYRGGLFGGAANTTATTVPSWACPSRELRVPIVLGDNTLGSIRVYTSGILQPSGVLGPASSTNWPVF